MKGEDENKDFLGDYDLSRTDKYYSVKIPSYSMETGVVLYEIVLKDLITNDIFVSSYRYKELKTMNDDLVKLKVTFANLVCPASFS
jgi:hypothetical protein